MAARIQFRRGNSAEWASTNPILAEGEPGVELDTDQFKIGNGVDAWNDLPYGGLVGPQGEIGPQGEQGPQGIQGIDGATGPEGPEGPQGPQGPQGIAGEVGPKGDDGKTGPKGPKGDNGIDGPSAYQVAVATGFNGTEAEFIASLRGPQGPAGERGPIGPAGPGGATGLDGLSAYQIAQINGFTGTEAEWLESLGGGGGGNGLSAYEVAVENGFVGTEAEWLESLVGADGAPGADGAQGETGPAGPAGADGPAGVDGLSAYQVAQANGFTGTEAEWLVSLKGADGEVGPQGPEGPQGTSINLLGSVATVGDLPLTGNSQNDAYTVDADGNLYVWDGTTWNDVGQIVGPQGPTGPTGPQGDEGIIISPTEPTNQDVLWLDEDAEAVGPIATISVTAPIVNTGNSSNAVIGIEQDLLRAIPMPVLRPSHYYTLPVGGTSNAAITLNNLYFMPFYFAEATTISRIGCNVSSGNASGVLRFGIYSAKTNADGPDTLISEASSTVVATTGFKYSTINVTVQRGWYWIAMAAQGTIGFNVTTLSGTGTTTPMPSGTFSSPPGANAYVGMYQISVSGALPTNPSGYGWLNAVPKLFIGI